MRSKNHVTVPTALKDRTVTKFDNIELTQIRIRSDNPTVIHACLMVDGELNLSADLDMCLKRIKEIVEEVRNHKEES